MTLGLLVATYLASLAQGACPASSHLVLIGGTSTTVEAPALDSDWELPCQDLVEGYEGLVRVTCLAKVPTLQHNCKAKACPAGQLAPVRISDSAELLPAATRGLAHDEQEAITCRSLKDGYLGHIILRCSFGQLSADAATCRPALKGARSAYRIVSGDFLQSWRVFEVSFHRSPNCRSRIPGHLFASSELSGLDGQALSADGNHSSFWSPWCPKGCPENTAWLGLALLEPAEVRCVKLQQSQVSCCRAQTLHFDIWDGADWQRAHSWDVSGVDLVVPSSCGRLQQVGLEDCEGLPVIGLKEGETCTVRCADGFVGGEEELLCQGEELVGTLPSCINVTQYTQISLYVGAGGMLLVLGCLYSCVCMLRKARLTFDLSELPKPFQGRWLESKGLTSWELILIQAQQQRAEAMAKQARAAGLRMLEEGTEKRPGQMEMSSTGYFSRHRSKKQGVDGLCSPCEDPDLCLAYTLCPLCRQADTWHTLGTPEWQTYWKVLTLYALCPWCCTCLNFYGRYRIRQAFGIPLEPHRDCLAHCVCCCCCTPCAHLQEARLVDAPILYYKSKHKVAEFQLRASREKAEKAEKL